MITKEDLQAAIAECQGQRNPNASTCIKLAAFYIIRDHLYGEQEERPQYSYASGPVESEGANTVPYISDSEFSQAIEGRDIVEVMEIMDDLMSTLQVVNPRLHASVMRKFEE